MRVFRRVCVRAHMRVRCACAICVSVCRDSACELMCCACVYYVHVFCCVVFVCVRVYVRAWVCVCVCVLHIRQTQCPLKHKQRHSCCRETKV